MVRADGTLGPPEGSGWTVNYFKGSYGSGGDRHARHMRGKVVTTATTTPTHQTIVRTQNKTWAKKTWTFTVSEPETNTGLTNSSPPSHGVVTVKCK